MPCRRVDVYRPLLPASGQKAGIGTPILVPPDLASKILKSVPVLLPDYEAWHHKNFHGHCRGNPDCHAVLFRSGRPPPADIYWGR